MCARFQACTKDSQLKYEKRILRYLKGMRDLVLFDLSSNSFDLVGYADATYVADMFYRKKNL